MNSSYRSVLLTSASIAALLPAIAGAQEEQDVIQLGTIYVTATTDETTQVDGYVADYNQSATKSDTPVAETPQSVSVVTAQQIEDQGASSLGEALRYSPGVLGDPYGVDPRFDSPTIRGFEARGSQYVNGLRQLRFMGAPAYETYALQQIEVLSGPNSSLYGAGSPAGIINQVQKRAQSYDFGEIGLGFDDNGSSQLFFDVNRVVNDDLALRFTGIGKDFKSQVEEIGNERGYLGFAARWKPADGTTIDFIASYTDDAPISPPGIPFALTGKGNDDYLRELYTGEEGWDNHDRQIFNFGYELSHELDNGWTFSQGFRYETFDWEYFGHYVNGTANGDTEITRGANYQLENTTGLSLDSRFAGEVFTGNVEHKLLFGLDLRRYEADTTTEFYDDTAGVTNLNWQNPVYGGIPTGAPWYVSKQDVTQTQIGIYAQDEFTAGRWRGSVALRYDWSKQEGTTYTNFAGTGTVDQKDDALSGRIGLGYEVSPGMLVYGNYSTSFDPEIGVDGDGKQLDPTTGEQFELGVKYQPDSFNGLFTAAIYDLRQENLTVNLGADQGRRQVGEVHSYGLELGAVAELANGLNLRASYAYNQTEQIDPSGANDGNQMPNAPEHLASLWLDREFTNGFRVGAGVRYVGDRKGDLANNFALDSFTVVDLAIGYTQDNVEASLNIGNLFDSNYLSNCGSFGCYYGEGRTISAKVSYKW